MTHGEPLSPMMGDVARELLGNPNQRMSRVHDGVLRFGSNGSIEVNLAEGWFADYEANVRGGVLDLITHKAGATDHASAFRWLEEHGIKEPSNDTGPTGSHFYDYQDENGAVLFRVERKVRNGKKTFLQHGPDGNGGFVCRKGCMQGVRLVPYRLPDLVMAVPGSIVFVCEGEKDADRLAANGLIATTNPGGAKKWRPEFAPYLEGLRVVVLEDNDPAGREHADIVMGTLEGLAQTAAVLRLPGLPDKGDVSDWLAMGGSTLQLRQLAEKALSDAGPDLLPLIDISAWEGDPPLRLSFWGDWLPVNQTTMLTGRGGVGKSLFEQCLLTAIAIGRPFLGMETTQRNTLYLTCEDDEAELWRRQDAINEAFGITRRDLVGKLFLCSLMGETDTALATFDQTGRLQRTARWRQFEATCKANEIALFAFDNATDAMAGDLNDLHQVAEFVNLLTGLAKTMNGAAMILHHPNKAGEDWLGSVAWHNKVRSRLIIEDGDEEGDPDARTIKNPKANYGPQGGKIGFRWYAGAFVREEDLSPDTAAQLREISIANAQCEAFLACLRQRASEGVERGVGPSPGPNYAPAQFEGMPEAKGYKKAALKSAMDRLFRMERIASEVVERPGKSGTKTIITEVAPNFPNASPNASRTHFPNGPELPPEHPRTHTHIPKGISGAAPQAAAPSSEAR